MPFTCYSQNNSVPWCGVPYYFRTNVLNPCVYLQNERTSECSWRQKGNRLPLWIREAKEGKKDHYILPVRINVNVNVKAYHTVLYFRIPSSLFPKDTFPQTWILRSPPDLSSSSAVSRVQVNLPQINLKRCLHFIIIGCLQNTSPLSLRHTYERSWTQS